MTTLHDDPRFSLTVQSGFDACGIWIIRAALRFKDGDARRDTAVVLRRALLALVDGIEKATLHGIALGARATQLVLELPDGVVFGERLDPSALN